MIVQVEGSRDFFENKQDFKSYVTHERQEYVLLAILNAIEACHKHKGTLR